jgi:hypothetical protein
MPILGVPALAGAGAGAGGGTVLFGGLTASQVIIAGVAAGTLVVSAVALGNIINDYLDRPVQQSETDRIVGQAGAVSKRERDKVRDCRNCRWCQINIQAQGNFLPLARRSDPQGIGPYFVLNRTVTAREGVIIAGLTHAFAETLATRRNYRRINDYNILGETIAFIQRCPPAGLGNGEYRAGSLERYSSDVRYDINVVCTINAFMA